MVVMLYMVKKIIKMEKGREREKIEKERESKFLLRLIFNLILLFLYKMFFLCDI